MLILVLGRLELNLIFSLSPSNPISVNHGTSFLTPIKKRKKKKKGCEKRKKLNFLFFMIYKDTREMTLKSPSSPVLLSHIMAEDDEQIPLFNPNSKARKSLLRKYQPSATKNIYLTFELLAELKN